jgi:hypothetical protein
MNHLQTIHLLQKKAGIYDTFSNWGHAGLDALGMIPLVGNIADVGNALWYGGEALAGHNRSNALMQMGMSGLAAIPGFGLLSTGAKYGHKALKGGKGFRNAFTQGTKGAWQDYGNKVRAGGSSLKRKALGDAMTNVGLNAAIVGGSNEFGQSKVNEALQNAISQYGSYDAIPEKIRSNLFGLSSQFKHRPIDYVPGAAPLHYFWNNNVDHEAFGKEQNETMYNAANNIWNTVTGKSSKPTGLSSAFPGLAAAALGIGVALM